MVECPERIEPLYVAVLALLPIYPPETHSFALIRSVQNVEISSEIILIRKRETYGSMRSGIYTAYFADSAVHILVISHALGGMQIERYLETVFVQKTEQLSVIGKKLRVPAVTRPARH